METKMSNFLNWFSRWCLYLIIFFIPLFVLPWTTEKFELNKSFLFYGLTLISLLCFLGRAVVLKNLEIKRTVLDRPLLILWLIYLIISLTSQERYLSFFGDFSFQNLSFIAFSLLLVFYFLVVQQINQLPQIVRLVKVFLFSGFLAALYFILQTSNLFDFSKFSLPNFSLVSSSNTLLGIFLSLVLIISWGFLTIRKKDFSFDLLAFLSWLVSLIVIVMIGFKLIWIVVLISLVINLAFYFTNLEHTRAVWTSVGLILLVASLLFVFLGQPKFLLKNLPMEVSLAPKLSWNLSTATLTSGLKNFFLGSGPATFVYDFSKFRPASMNLNFAWNVRFNQSYSAALDWLTTNGLLSTLGLLAIILIVFGVMTGTWLRQIAELKKKKRFLEDEDGTEIDLTKSPLVFWGLAGGWFCLLVSFFLVNFGIVGWVLFWLFTALVLIAGSVFSKVSLKTQVISLKTAPQFVFLTSFLFILVFSFIIVLSVYLSRFYLAEVVYARSLNEPLDKKIASLQEAVNLNPNRIQFYLASAQVVLNKASEVANTTKDINQVSQLVATSVNLAKVATDRSPNNVASWEFLSTMYANARPIAPEANNWVINSLEQAIQLEPTNPTLYLGLGNAKLLEKRYSEAKEDYNKAIFLKPDLLLAYLSLANLSEVQNKIDDSITDLEKGLNYGRQNPEYLFQLGRYYYNRNKKDDAVLAELALQRAIQINPNYSDALFALGMFYERKGLKQSALPFYKRVLELNPNLKDLQSKIDSLSGAVVPIPVAPITPPATLPLTPDKKK